MKLDQDRHGRKRRDSVKAGKFSVEFIHVNHSIAGFSVALAIHTGLGTVVHTGDFKIDSTPIDGEIIDLARFGELGKQGVLRAARGLHERRAPRLHA